jgi:hypothetical protein
MAVLKTLMFKESSFSAKARKTVRTPLSLSAFELGVGDGVAEVCKTLSFHCGFLKKVEFRRFPPEVAGLNSMVA